MKRSNTVLQLRGLRLWNAIPLYSSSNFGLFSLHHLRGPHFLPCTFPLCTICLQCWPQAQLWPVMESLRFHIQRYSCPKEVFSGFFTDNTSCSGGTRMMNPCFLGLHSAPEFLLLSYSCQSTKAPLSRHSNAPFGCQKSDRLLFIALFTIFSQTLWIFLFLQQNIQILFFHFTLTHFDILCSHLHCAELAELQYDRVVSQILLSKKVTKTSVQKFRAM